MSQLIDNLNTIESIKTDIKTAIENKGVDMTGVSFPGYASKIGEISGGGGLNQKNLTEKKYGIINLDNYASFVASRAFIGDTTIQTVNLPYATTVGAAAFESCSSLSQVSLPVCSYIGDWAFRVCRSLTQVSLPMCEYVGDAAFRSCSSLTQVSLPVCLYISSAAFESCSSLSQVSLPVCSYIGDWAFYNCSSLSQVSLPVCSTIGWDAFWECSLLSIITIGYSSVCILSSTNVFDGTQITSSTGIIYVPASLVDAYKSAPNWSYYSSQIFPISE